MTLGQMTNMETSRITSDNHGLKMGVGGTRALAHLLYLYIKKNTQVGLTIVTTQGYHGDI